MNYRSQLIYGPLPLRSPDEQPGTPGTETEPKNAPPPVDDDSTFEDEDIVIDDAGEGEGEATPADTAPAEDAPPAPKKRGPKRYAELNRRAQEAQDYARRVEEENARLKARAEKAEADAAAANDVAVQTYAAKADSDLVKAKREYAEALKSDDADKITEATAALASAQQAKDDIEAWKKREKQVAAPPAEKPADRQPQPREEIQDVAPHIRDWMVENRYFDPVARDARGNIVTDKSGNPLRNDDFDPEMNAEATLFARRIERQIIRGQLHVKEGSSEYFKLIDDHMREEFPDYFDGEEAPPARPQRQPGKGSPVAAPGARSTPGAPPKSGQKAVKLAAHEIRFIAKQVQNGGGPKYPKGHPKQFQPMTFDDAKVSFAKRKLAQASQS